MSDQLYRVEVWHEGIEQPDVSYTYEDIDPPSLGGPTGITHYRVTRVDFGKPFVTRFSRWWWFWWRLWRIIRGRGRL